MTLVGSVGTRAICALGTLAMLACASGGDGEARLVQANKHEDERETASSAPAPAAKGSAEETAEAAPALREENPSASADTPSVKADHPMAVDESESHARLRKLLEYDPEDPLGNLDEADRLAGDVAAASVEEGGPCREDRPMQRLFSDPYRVALTAAGNDFVAAAYVKDKSGEHVRLLHVPDKGKPRPLPPFKLPVPHEKTRVAPPGLVARDRAQVTLAVVDGSGHLLVSELGLGSSKTGVHTRVVHDGIDSRFAPAIVHVEGGTVVAFTLGTTPMRTLVARVPASSAQPKITDITPPGLSAAAPSFVDGHSPPWLVALDARAANSHVLTAPLDKEGVPKVGEIAAPVGMTPGSTELAAVFDGKRARVAYVGIGSESTTAIGLVDLNPATPPIALVKGTAYGPLHVSALRLGDESLFVADAPQTPGKDPKHDVQFTLIDRGGNRRVGFVRGGPSGASGVAVAKRADGLVGVAFTTTEAVYLSLLRCK